MFAATAAGLYPKVEAAMDAMGQGFDIEYVPNQQLVVIYKNRYEKYKTMGSFFEEQTKRLVSASPSYNTTAK